METTLEVRWFFRGIPPASVQRWFRLKCPGKLLGKSEKRKDLYALLKQEHFDSLARFLTRRLSREQVNLKFRQGNLELKIEQQELGIYRFSHSQQSLICEGKVEQWCKSDRQMLDLALPTNLLQETEWIAVDKEREQKIEQGVKSELTWLKCNRKCWWTIAFEMISNESDGQQNSCFQNVVNRACQTYSGSKLLSTNSFGYSQWLLESVLKP